MARIGVNALYLIPGGVGGTEIYLRELLAALAALDPANEYFVFTNLETQADLVPRQANFHWKPQAVHARFRPGADLVGANRSAVRSGPLSPGCSVQSRIHRAGILALPAGDGVPRPAAQTPSGIFPLVRSAVLAIALVGRGAPLARLIAVSEATRADLLRFYRIPQERIAVITHGVEPAFSAAGQIADASRTCCAFRRCIRTRICLV